MRERRGEKKEERDSEERRRKDGSKFFLSFLLSYSLGLDAGSSQHGRIDGKRLFQRESVLSPKQAQWKKGSSTGSHRRRRKKARPAARMVEGGEARRLLTTFSMFCI